MAPPKDHASHGAGLTLLMCLSQVAGLLSFAVFATLLPGFLTAWTLTGTEAGWLNGVFFLGYVIGVPVLLGLTDRIDARTVYIASAMLSMAAQVGFALFAEGFWSALVFRAALGIGFAGTYMPGAKILIDRLEQTDVSRPVAFYTASYGLGASLSYYLAGAINQALDWHWAFGLTALGSLVAIVIVFLGTQRRPPPDPDTTTWLFDFRPVLKNRQALGYMLAYAVHNFELMASMSWVVAFLTYSASQQFDVAAGWNIALIGGLVTLIALPASILGNEVAMRLGRRRTVSTIMLVSAALACGIGFSSTLPFAVVAALCLLYGATTMADSASVTAGTVMATPPAERGAAMAMHSFIGFIGAGAGPLVFGVILDLSGGPDTFMAWGIAFAVMGVVAVIGPFVLAPDGAKSEP